MIKNIDTGIFVFKNLVVAFRELFLFKPYWPKLTELWQCVVTDLVIRNVPEVLHSTGRGNKRAEHSIQSGKLKNLVTFH